MPRIEEEIKQDIVNQLAWDNRVNAAEIEVEVHDSTVTLRGNVPDYWSRLSAIEDARFISGVARVNDELMVRWPSVYSPTDEELWENIDRALRANPNIDVARIAPEVIDGVVSLEGTVDAFWKKLHAERIVSDLPGVIEVENRLAIVPTRSISDEAIATQIVDALRRNVLVDSESLDVRVTNGVVTLDGSVPNWAAANAARNVAYHTSGVVDVRENLAVAV